jgi:hypothetical protein
MLIVGYIELHIIHVETQFGGFINLMPAVEIYSTSFKLGDVFAKGINRRIDTIVFVHPVDVAGKMSVSVKDAPGKYKAQRGAIAYKEI